MIKKGIIKSVNDINDKQKLLKCFASGLEVDAISKYGRIKSVERPKRRLVIDFSGTWFEISVKPDEASGALLQCKTNRKDVNEYPYEELLEHAIEVKGEDGVYTGLLEGTIETHDCDTLKVKCDHCKGNGVCPECLGKKIITCPQCEGDGDCPNCHGTGKVDCYVCDGTGNCSSCGGDGEEWCDCCGGDGEVDCDSCFHGEYYTKSGRYVKCRDCGGTGKVTCDNCDGDGTVTCCVCHGSGRCRRCDGRGDFYCRECDHHNGKCKMCHGKGEIKCPECKGMGKCYKCKGTGIINCPRCDGTGKYQTFKSFTITSHKKDKHIIDNVTLYTHSLSEFAGRDVYDGVVEKYSQLNECKTDFSKINQVLDSANVNKIIEKFEKFKLQNNKSTLRPYVFSVKVAIIDDYKVSYEFGDENYYFHIVGKDFDVVYDKIPSWRKRTWNKIKNWF